MLQSLIARTFRTRSIAVRLPGGRTIRGGPGAPELTVVVEDMKTAMAIALNLSLIHI